MPQVVEVTVYKLEELKQFGDKVYEKAVQNTIEYANCGGVWVQWLSQDINEWFNWGADVKHEHASPFDGGERHEWDADRRTFTYKFSVYLPDYMKRKGLHLTCRSFYQWMKQTGGYTLGGLVGTGLHRGGDHAPLPDDIDEDIQRDIDNGWAGEDKRTVARIKAQVEKVLDVLGGDVEATTAKLVKWVVDECDWRYTEEFAKGEAEAHELVFRQNGKIFHK